LFVCFVCVCVEFFFFFNDTATTEIYTLSLHDALPIFRRYDLGLLWLNLLHLLGICFLPFPTELLGRYFDTAGAGFLYGGTLTATSVFGAAIWFYSRARQLTGSLDRDVRRATTFRAIATPIAFLIGTAFVPISMSVAVAIWGLLLPLTRSVVTVAARTKTES